MPIFKTVSQKPLVLNLDWRLSFNHHIMKKVGKAMKDVGLLVNCNIFTTLKSAIYKSLKRPHLEYGDVTYDQP